MSRSSKTLTYALIMGHIDLFRCFEDFGKFWSSRAIIYLTHFAILGDLILCRKVKSDVFNISDSDRDKCWNVSWDKSLECRSSNCCLYVTDLCHVSIGFFVTC